MKQLEEKLKAKSTEAMVYGKIVKSDTSITMQKQTVIKLTDAIAICQQEIDEACKKQRESDAEIFKGYCALGRGELFAYEDDFNIYCKILANAPTPKESK